MLAEGEKRRLEILRCGLIPPWVDDPQIGSRMINARAEPAAEKSSFCKACGCCRCLIPADRFYERMHTNGSTQPYYIFMKDERPFAEFWESWNDNGGPALRSCTILTTRSNALVGEIHDRMPVILPAGSYEAWLDPETARDEPAALLMPYPEDGMEAYPVGRFVNSPSNNDPRCVKPAA